MTEAQAQDTFSTEDFLNEVQSGYAEFDTNYVAVPVGDYPMSVKQGSTKIISGETNGRKWRKYTALAVIDSPEASAAVNRADPQAKVAFWLDLNDAGNGLASGTNKNVQLNRLLVATGNAKPGWSYAAIEGVPFLGHIKHVTDKDDASKVYAEVDQFAKA